MDRRRARSTTQTTRTRGTTTRSSSSTAVTCSRIRSTRRQRTRWWVLATGECGENPRHRVANDARQIGGLDRHRRPGASEVFERLADSSDCVAATHVDGPILRIGASPVTGAAPSGGRSQGDQAPRLLDHGDRGPVICAGAIARPSPLPRLRFGMRGRQGPEQHRVVVASPWGGHTSGGTVPRSPTADSPEGSTPCRGRTRSVLAQRDYV
jgi:hypothetical protein